MNCPTCNGRGKIQSGYAGEVLIDCPDCQHPFACGDCDPCLAGHPERCAVSAGIRSGKLNELSPWQINPEGAHMLELDCEKRTKFINEICELAAIGSSWRKNSSLEKWFPLTAEELEAVKRNYAGLYKLVEAYLTIPNTDPKIRNAYDNLVLWFVQHNKPDGSPPLPVSDFNEG